MDAHMLARTEAIGQTNYKGLEGGRIWRNMDVWNWVGDEPQTYLFRHSALFTKSEQISLVFFQERNQGFNAFALHSEQIIFQPVTAARFHHNCERCR